MKTIFKRTAARLRRWCFGNVERDAAPPIETIPWKPREVKIRVSAFTSAEELRKQISEATGLPIENVKLLPIRVHTCTCPECMRKQKAMQILRPHPN